jgi:hypothetical protein
MNYDLDQFDETDYNFTVKKIIKKNYYLCPQYNLLPISPEYTMPLGIRLLAANPPNPF